MGSVDSGRAVIRDVLAEFGVAPDAYVLADGSGLSRYDEVAPEAIAAVLEAMYHRPDFPRLPRRAPGRRRGRHARHPARGDGRRGERARQDGLDVGRARPLGLRAHAASGETLLFVLLANDVTAPRRVVEAAQDRIVERLANFARAGR